MTKIIIKKYYKLFNFTKKKIQARIESSSAYTSFNQLNMLKVMNNNAKYWDQLSQHTLLTA